MCQKFLHSNYFLCISGFDESTNSMPNHPTRKFPELSDLERAELERWVRRPTTAQSLAFRAQIILMAAEGLRDQALAEKLETTRASGESVFGHSAVTD